MSDENDKNVGIRLSEERRRSGINQKLLADKLGTAPRTVSRWEQGDSIPSDKLIAMQAIGLDVGYILFGERKMRAAERVRNLINANVDKNVTSVDARLLAHVIDTVERQISRARGEFAISAKAQVVAALYKSYFNKEQQPLPDDPGVAALIELLLLQKDER